VCDDEKQAADSVLEHRCIGAISSVAQE